MFIYLYGPDSYRRQEKLKAVVEQYEKKYSGLTVDRFYLDVEEEFERLKNFCASQSLFGGSKLGIVYNPFDLSDKKELAKFLKLSLAGQISLAVVSEKPPAKDFQFLLEKPILFQEFGELSPVQISAFIKYESEKLGVKLSPDFINILIRANGADTWGIVRELEKMALGGRPEDTEAAPNFFVLLNKLIGQSLPQKISALTRLLENEEPAKIFNMLAASDGPAVKPGSENSAAWKIKMADYDAAIKSGKLDYEEVLLDAILT